MSRFEPLLAVTAGDTAASSLGGANVLLVDDDSRNGFAMTALLEQCHAQVTVIESGTQAVATLEHKPDTNIVLMDIMMPVMDGYATIRAIRTTGRVETLPIIAVTGKVVDGERQRCLRAGANDYVPKPVNRSELLAAIKPWLPDGLVEDPHSPTVPAIATARLPVLIVGKDEAERMALRAALVPLGYSIVEADSGLAALRHVMVQNFAVILLDARTAATDAFETAGLIRQRHQSAMTPIIYLVRQASDLVTYRAPLADGISDYLCCPSLSEALQTKLAFLDGL